MKSLAKKLVFALLCLGTSLSLAAQTVKITGVVTDENGEPLMGAGVFVEGTTTGTVTGIDGDYELVVPEKAANLVFSFIGLADQTVPIAGRTKIDVQLRPDATFLDEVVVVGYATVTRRDVVGSISSVNSESLNQVPVASVTEAMAGKMAGVQVTTTEGNPDADIKIRVRGAGSITQDSSPLYIVDGFPMESISDIPASDIQSIDVLKDAFSTAIYGSRGANGVIIVTTKSGKEGKVTVNFNAYAGIKQMANKNAFVPQNAYDFVRTQYEYALYRDNVSSFYESRYGTFDDMDLYKGMATNDWVDQVFGRTGHNLSHNLSVSGGNDKVKWTVGYAHFDETAIMVGSDYSRNNLNFKSNVKTSKKTSIDLNVRYSNVKVSGSGANAINDRGSTSQSRLKNSIVYSPIPVSAILSDSDIEEDYNSSVNPLVAIADSDSRQNRTQWTANGAFQWKIIDNLTLRLEGGLDEYRRIDDKFYGLTNYYVRQNATPGYRTNPAVEYKDATRRKVRNTNTLNYDFKALIPEDHNLNVLVGTEYIISKSNTFNSVMDGLPDFFDAAMAWNFTASGEAPKAISNTYSNDDKILSFFGRVNYSFKDKYQLSATMRADGSSKFTKGNKWGYFPSFAASWRISGEEFMENTRTWLDNLKLRYSFGTAGNNNIPAGKTMQEYGPRQGSNDWISQSTVWWGAGTDMANPELKWETTYSHNLGLDWSLFKSRLYGSLEVYQADTRDLLIHYDVTGSGYNYQYRNLGSILNRGVEFSIGGAIIRKKDYGVNFDGNISFNQNRVMDLGGMKEITENAGMFSTEITYDFKVTEGRPLGDIYGFVNDGMYKIEDFNYDTATGTWTLKEGIPDASGITGYAARPGSMKLKDVSGPDGKKDGVIDNNDITLLGNMQPLFTGGFSISAYWKGFDFASNFTYSYGNKVYNANKVDFSTIRGVAGQNVIEAMSPDNRWTNVDWKTGEFYTDPAKLAAANKGKTMWAPYNTRRICQSYALEDASFLRLATITLGYTIPEEVTQKYKLNKVRVYVTANNVFCLTPYSGYDPEVDTRTATPLTPNVDYSAYPKSHSWVAGINLTF
ncbi:MAG: TonB-dependent receptor [Bacteroidales bacterium]|nr:TonB-dependent receptor [Bacteroidales bacterium]